RSCSREARRLMKIMELFVFVVAGAMVLGGAVGVVVRTNPVHAALSLVATLFGIAVLFVAQHADFLAAVQVIVYAGAIVVLFLFVIMLLGVDQSEDLETEPLGGQRPAAIAVGGALLGAVRLLVRRNPLVMFMCIELMLNAVNLTFVAFASALDDVGGQAVVFFVLVVAAAEVVVGLGIIVALMRKHPGATADDIATLKG